MRLASDLEFNSSLETSGSTAGGPKERRMTLLVVEENAETRIGLKELLEGNDYRVLDAKDEHSALDAASRERFELILVDLDLPYREGLAVGHRIRQKGTSPDAPIVVIPPDGEAESLEDEFTVVPGEYVIKMVDFDQLKDLLARLLA